MGPAQAPCYFCTMSIYMHVSLPGDGDLLVWHTQSKCKLERGYSGVVWNTLFNFGVGFFFCLVYFRYLEMDTWGEVEVQWYLKPNKSYGLCLSAHRWLTVHGTKPAQQRVCSGASPFLVDADTLFSCTVPEWEAYLQCCSEILFDFKSYWQRWLQSPLSSPARAEYL